MDRLRIIKRSYIYELSMNRLENDDSLKHQSYTGVFFLSFVRIPTQFQLKNTLEVCTMCTKKTRIYSHTSRRKIHKSLSG